MEAARTKWTDDRLDDQASALEKSFSRIGSRLDEVSEAVAPVDMRFDHVDGELEIVGKNFTSVDKRFDRLEDKIDRVQLMMLQLVGGAFVVTFGAVAALFLSRT